MSPGHDHDGLERLRALQRDAAEPDGARRLLARFADEAGGRAVLFDPGGTAIASSSDAPVPDEIALIARRVRLGPSRSAVERDGDEQLAAFAINGDPDAPTLALTGPALDHFTAEPWRTDALRVLSLSWQVQHARDRAQRVGNADDQIREAVLHLLMEGRLPTAHRAAEALHDPLPDPMRVWVVEVGSLGEGERNSVADELARITGDRAWMIKCPVYSGHLIPAVAPAGHEHEQACLRELVTSANAVTGRISVGISTVLPLRDFGTGYQQAFHALAHARGNAEGFATFRRSHDLAAELDGVGRTWARGVLLPLEEFEPTRPQDPTGDDLRDTLVSWLAFHQQATRHLKIHRNTLSARLQKIGSLLGRDLHRLPDQAQLDLALRLRAGRGDPQPPRDLDDLLRGDEVRRWAEVLLAPLRESPRLVETVRAWLRADARPSLAAEALGISAAAARKRLANAEQLLERSLLHSPSLSYDLHLAFRALDLRPEIEAEKS
ncbi:helix-turn-helix domain-containing protein [Saccharopolyspora tripterygii]